MKTTISRLLLAWGVLLALPMVAQAQVPAPGPDMLLIRSADKSPEQVVDAIKSYAEGKKWLYMGASKAKQGEVTMVKVCLPQVGQILWPLGLQVSAMLPCGNVGVYQKHGQTQISLLHPQYMQLIYPRPEVEKAVAVAAPQLIDMLDTVAK